MASVVHHGHTQPVAKPSHAVHHALQSWQALYDRLPIASYVCDAGGVIVHYNGRAADLWGRAPEPGEPDERYCGAHRLFLPDGSALAHADTPMADVLRTGRPARDMEVIVERPDGSRLPVLVNIDPIFGDDGELVGAVNCFQDISRLKQTEADLEEREQWFRELLEALPAAIYTTDAAGRITFYNQAAVDLSGRRPVLGSDEWCVTWRLYWPDGTPLPHDQCPMAVALKEGRPVRDCEAVAERPDGTRVPFIPYPTPLRNAAGQLVGAVNMLVDVSERKAAESEQRRMLHELNHRVKNTLATVQSLASHTIADAGASKAFEARLISLSRAHDQLTRNGWQAVDVASVVDEILQPYRTTCADRITLDGTPAVLAPNVALTLAMVLHELAANAATHGSLAAADGRLGVHWTVSKAGGGRRLKIAWQESGGPPLSKPARYGFGARLAERAITRVLKGTVDMDFDPGGMCCTMAIPLAKGE